MNEMIRQTESQGYTLTLNIQWIKLLSWNLEKEDFWGCMHQETITVKLQERNTEYSSEKITIIMLIFVWETGNHLVPDFQTPKQKSGLIVTFRTMIFTVQEKSQKFSEYSPKRCIILTQPRVFRIFQISLPHHPVIIQTEQSVLETKNLGSRGANRRHLTKDETINHVREPLKNDSILSVRSDWSQLQHPSTTPNQIVRKCFCFLTSFKTFRCWIKATNKTRCNLLNIVFCSQKATQNICQNLFASQKGVLFPRCSQQAKSIN